MSNEATHARTRRLCRLAGSALATLFLLTGCFAQTTDLDKQANGLTETASTTMAVEEATGASETFCFGGLTRTWTTLKNGALSTFGSSSDPRFKMVDNYANTRGVRNF